MIHKNSMSLLGGVAKRMAMAAAMVTPATLNAGAEGIEATVQGDLVSSYVWRGMYQTGASFQPTLGIGIGGLSLTAWGSTDFDGSASSSGRAQKEIDLTLGYEASCGVGISVTDYWWEGQGALSYFDYAAHTTGHHFEGTLCYSLPVEKFPLAISWSTMFAGNDFNADGKRAYSSYLQFSYPIAVKNVDFTLTAGMSPYKSQGLYGCESFAVTDLSARGTYTIHAGSGVDLPVFSQLTFNPRASDAHIVFGISIVPTKL